MGIFRGKSQSPHERIVVGVISGVGGTFFVSVFGAIATHEMAFRYGPKEFSIFVTAVALGSVVQNFTDLGLFPVLQRDIARDQLRAPRLMGLVIGLRITLSAIVIPVAAGISLAVYRHHPSSLKIAIFLVLLSLPFTAVQQVISAYYSATARLPTVAVIGVVKQTIFVLLVMLIIFDHFSILYCVAATLTGSIFSTAVSFLLVQRQVQLRFVVDRREWGKMLVETASVGAASILGTFYLNADILILSVMTAPKQVGYYGVAYAVISAFQTIPTLLSIAILPMIVRTARVRLNTVVNTAIVYYAIAGAFVAALGVVCGASVIRLYAGPHFVGAVFPLQILSCGQIFLFMTQGLSSMSIARGHHRKLIQCSLVGFMLNVALNLAIIPHFGIRGSAAATTLCEVLLSMVMAWIIRRDLGVKPHIFRASWKSVVAAAIPCVVLWHWYAHGKASAPIGLFLMVPTAMLFLLVLFLLRGIPGELMPTIRTIMSRKEGRLS